MKINYSKDVSVELKDNLLIIRAKGEEYKLEVEECTKDKEGVFHLLLKGDKFKPTAEINNKTCCIHTPISFDFIDDEGIIAGRADGYVFFKHNIEDYPAALNEYKLIEEDKRKNAPQKYIEYWKEAKEIEKQIADLQEMAALVNKDMKECLAYID